MCDKGFHKSPEIVRLVEGAKPGGVRAGYVHLDGGDERMQPLVRAGFRKLRLAQSKLREIDG